MFPFTLMFILQRMVFRVFLKWIIGGESYLGLYVYRLIGSFSYNKTENLSIDDLIQFDYLLVESTNDEDQRLKSYLSRDFRIVDFVRAFNGFYLDQRLLPRMRSIPKIYLLEKKKKPY